MRLMLLLAFLNVFSLNGFSMASRVAAVSDLPVGCLQQHEYPCAIQAEATQEIGLVAGNLAVERGAQVVLLSKDAFQLVKGQVWVSGFKGNIRFGEVNFSPEGDALFVRSEKAKMVVWALDGNIKVKDPRGDQPILGSGFSNWYLGLGKNQDVQQGILQPSEVKDLARRLVSVWGRKADSHKDDFERYREQQKTAQLAAGELYQQVIGLRQVAAAKEEEVRQLKAREKENEKLRFRKMFRARFYEGLDPES